jgi:hypothetical protein
MPKTENFFLSLFFCLLKTENFFCVIQKFYANFAPQIFN